MTTMRLHRTLVFAVIDGLHQIFNEGKYADKVIQKLLKRDNRWGSRDRGFIAETTYEIVRYKRLYTEIAEVKEPYSRENLWRVFIVWAVLRGIPLPDWKQIGNTPTRRIKGKFDELIKIRKYRESIPDWLDTTGTTELKSQWEDEIHAQNQQAPVILRVNTLKGTREELQKRLIQDEVDTFAIKKYPDALQLVERSNVFNTAAFKEGLFEVQDANSQKVAQLLQPEPGQRVIDACAGAGGKTLHISAMMQNKGQVIAMDIYKSKLLELKRRSRRAGAHNITTRLIENSKDYKKFYGQADKVLIDAPCSGLGILRRNPDAKWKLQPDFLTTIKTTQQQILLTYAKFVKPGGSLVYATCSILPSENQQQVQTFLTTEIGQSFTKKKDEKYLVHSSGHDGFYMALLQKEM